MNLVVMSCLSPKDMGILASLQKQWPMRLVIQPDWTGNSSTQSKWTKLRRAPWTTLSRRLQKPFYDRQAQQLDAQITELCFGTAKTPPLAGTRALVPRREINSDAVATMLRGVEADVMITSSCPLLKSNVFNAPRLGTINVHWGIAPHYRGDHTQFWPLYYGDYENIGITIHRIDEGIDTGPVLAQGFPQLEATDTEATLYAKCARLAADLLDGVLTQIETTGSIEALPTARGGRLFRERDRNVWHELVYGARRKLGLRNIPERAERRLINTASPELVLT